jgi:hypothetical protein
VATVNFVLLVSLRKAGGKALNVNDTLCYMGSEIYFEHPIPPHLLVNAGPI